MQYIHWKNVYYGLKNELGYIQSTGLLNINCRDIYNSEGAIYSEEDLNIDAYDYGPSVKGPGIETCDIGEFGSIDNDSGYIGSGDNVNILTLVFSNVAGTIDSPESIVIDSSSIDNSQGTIYTEANLDITNVYYQNTMYE